MKKVSSSKTAWLLVVQVITAYNFAGSDFAGSDFAGHP
jgi:hypothetical protein